MTPITLLEKLGADASFDPSMLSVEDRKTLEDIIIKAETFNAITSITTPDEDETDEDETDEDEKS